MTIPISKAKARLTAQVTDSSTSISFTGTDSSRSLESVTMADFGSAGYITINPAGSVGNYEIVKFTSWSVSSSVITVSGLTRNLQLQGSDSGQTGLSFAAGTTVIVGNNHHWWNQLANTGIQATTSVAGTVEIATDAEVAAGTTTGGSGAIVVAPASSHTTTPTASKVPVSSTNGVIDQGWVDIPFTAGESIDASTIPKAVYLKASDGKIYKSSATAYGEALFAFVGFVGEGQNLSANDTAKVRVHGVVDGFPGATFTIGDFIYITDTAGTVSATPGTKPYQVGRAKSATELVIEKGAKRAYGTQSFTSTTTAAITCGFKPSSVKISALMFLTHPNISNGVFQAPSSNICVLVRSTGAGSQNTRSWFVADGANSHEGTVTTLTNTGFTLDNTKTNTPDTVQILWEAKG